VCVYCGSSPGGDPVYEEAARATGGLLADTGITLVYGGGSVGLMGALLHDFLRLAVDAGFMKAQNLELITNVGSVDELPAALASIW
jgi:hypothetical protein